MKSNNPRITLLGNNSGRNLGDMAIMSSIFESISSRLPNAEFYVPSINPEWTKKHYGSKYNVHAINVMPWTGSLRLLGIPTANAMAKSDVALICDGIIFGKKLFNPAFNYLITLAPLIPIAKALNCKMVSYSCGIGPFPSDLSRKLARYVIDNCDLVMMRERDSLALTKEIGVSKEVALTGDAAFINPVSSDARAVEVMKELGLNPEANYLAINVTSYLDTWLEPNERLSSPESFIDTVAVGVNKARERTNSNFTPLVICTQPMDSETCNKLAEKLNCKVLSNSTYLSHDIQAVIRRCGLLVGMRFHSIVLSSSVETPVIGLIYAPKVRGYLRLLGCEDYGLELKGITPDSLAEKITTAWGIRAELKAQQSPTIAGLKQGAEHAADLLVERFFSSSSKNALAA